MNFVNKDVKHTQTPSHTCTFTTFNSLFTKLSVGQSPSVGATGSPLPETAAPGVYLDEQKSMHVATGKGQGLSSYTRMGLQRRFSGCNLELKPDMKPVAKGNSNHLRDQTGARCAERPGGSELRPGSFTKGSVWFCRFAFEDLFLCLPMLSAPPVPTWLRVKAAGSRRNLQRAGALRKPFSSSFTENVLILQNVLETLLLGGRCYQQSEAQHRPPA